MSRFRWVALLVLASLHPLEAQQSRPQQWRVDPKPIVHIGGADVAEHQQFVRVSTTLRRNDGSILIVDNGGLARGMGAIRISRPDGAMLWEAGRRGEGPGEFAVISWSTMVKDTLLLYDAQQRRITRIGGDGKLVRTESLASLNMPGALVGRFSNGSWFFRGQTLNPVPGGWRDTVTYSAMPAGGTSLVPLAKRLAYDMRGTSAAAQAVVFGRSIIYVIGADRLYFGDGGEPEVSVVSQDGKALPPIRWQEERVKVTDVDRQREATARQAERAALGNPAPIPVLEFAEYFPAYSRLRIDKDRNLWVERFPRPGEPSTWMIFDSTGRQLASVTLPERFRLLEAGHDYVLGVWLDPDDVQCVRMYKLIR